MYFKYYLSVILVVSLAFITLSNSLKISVNVNYFLTSHETALFLREDKDRYINKMTDVDLYARKSKTVSEYTGKIVNCATSFSDQEKIKLTRCAHKADIFLTSFVYHNSIDCKEIAKIQWRFALTRKSGNDEYEEGLPHTRSDVIFLSGYTINDTIARSTDDSVLTSTLIHEKVHIFQRYNEKLMNEIIQKTHYVANSNDIEGLRLKRCNPDTNDKNYYSKANNKLMLFIYNSSTPKGINDISSRNYAIEHPYETMAYEIANEYTKRNLIELTKRM